MSGGLIVSLADASIVASRHTGLIVGALLLVLGPGYAIAAGVGRGVRADLRLALSPGFGLIALTLLWWAATLVGVPLGRTALLVYALPLTAFALASLVHARVGWQDAMWLAAVSLATLICRLAAIRDVALPPWVDGVHHTYIARLLIEVGGVPNDYEPLLSIGTFAYHFGFHALAASASLVAGGAVPDAVLVAGQVVSAFAAPTAYLLARLYGGSPRVALTAAVLAGLVSVMPAYFVSWSRFTQMAGLVALPTWLWMVRTMGADWRRCLLCGAAGSGLLMIHPRVAVMAAVLVLADRLLWRSDLTRPVRGVIVALTAALGLGAPWLVRLGTTLVPRLAGADDEGQLGDSLDFASLSTYLDPLLYGLAAGGAIGGFLLGARAAMVAIVWLGVMVALANPARLGLPGAYMVSNGSLLISLWLPGSALAAAVLARATNLTQGWLRRAALSRTERGGLRRLLARFIGRVDAARLVAPAVLLGGLLAAVPTARSVNQTTVLATEADRAVLAGAAALLPSDAIVAAEVRHWQFGTYRGNDGGYWIGVVTPGRSLIPPLLYGLGPAAEARRISASLAEWAAVPTDAAAIANAMRARGAEWLFVGERSGMPREGMEPAGFTTVASSGDARLFRLR